MAKPGNNAHLVIRHKALECIGCCLCEETIPQYFEIDDDGMAQLLNSSQEGVFQRTTALRLDQAAIEAAVTGCPVSIIRVDKS